MTWFKADDAFPQHPKVLAMPRRDRAAAVGLWTLAGTWASGQLTDGYVPRYMVDELAGTKKSAQLLVSVGLWLEVEGGYQFHDWLKYNPSAEEVRADQARKHEAKVRAGRSGGLASGVARRKHSPSTDEAESKQTPSETKPRPVPSRSTSYEVEDSDAPRKRGRRIPDDFTVTDDMRKWAIDNGFGHLDLDQLTDEFRDYWAAEAGARAAKLDWVKTWQNRVREVSKRTPARSASNGHRANPNKLPAAWLS